MLSGLGEPEGKPVAWMVPNGSECWSVCVCRGCLLAVQVVFGGLWSFWVDPVCEYGEEGSVVSWYREVVSLKS